MKVTHYAILSDKREIPLNHATFAMVNEAKSQGKPAEMIEIPNPDTNQILFHGELRLVKEFKYVDETEENRRAKENREQYIFEKDFLEKNIKKQEWTKNKLLELQPDEIEYFQDMANHQMEFSIRKGMVGPKHLQERAMCLIRKHFNCPFA